MFVSSYVGLEKKQTSKLVYEVFFYILLAVHLNIFIY